VVGSPSPPVDLVGAWIGPWRPWGRATRRLGAP